MSLSEQAWSARFESSRLAWQAVSGECDAGPIAKTGVAWTPISYQWAAKLMFMFWFSPPKELLRDDCLEGYMAEPREGALASLNEDNEYHAVQPDLMAALHGFIGEHAGWITEQVAHPWKVCSTRTFALRAREEPGGKHFDGWPKSIRKAFILPAGASRQGGTTWFGLRDGTEMVFDHPDPCLVIFENSAVEHCSMPGVIYRPTIEFDLVPARHTDASPVYAGLNGWFPWEPS